MSAKSNFTSPSPTKGQLGSTDHEKYIAMIGGIRYASVCPCLDVSFEVLVLAIQTHVAYPRHHIISMRPERYISGTAKDRIFYGRSYGSLEPLKGHSDSDWAVCKDARKSTSGVVVTGLTIPLSTGHECANLFSVLVLRKRNTSRFNSAKNNSLPFVVSSLNYSSTRLATLNLGCEQQSFEWVILLHYYSPLIDKSPRATETSR